jgi:hypothetical protein
MIPDWMKNAYTFASTPEEKATIMPVWDEVEECGSVYIENGHVNVSAPLASLQGWSEKYPKGWVSILPATWTGNGYWSTANIRMDLYIIK